MPDLLAALEEARCRFGPGEARRTERLLERLARRRFRDADSLIRFHETLLFLRAYPASEGVRRRADELLASFSPRAALLKGDPAPLEEPEVSGIAGTGLSAVFSYDVARALRGQRHGRLDIDWEGYDTGRLARCWRHLLPLLEEDTLVEAVVPYRQWLRHAKGGRGSDLAWMLDRLERLRLPARDRQDLYEALELPLRWELDDSPAARTHTRLPVRRFFYHDAPMLRRRDVRLEDELAAGPLPLARLSPAAGRRLLNLARETSAVRYRELYGFTYGDPARVLKADFGRGTRVYVFGVPAERRLPLRAYHAGLVVKNGVPVGYIETLTLFERMEVGFNVYYTFREGESAWLYGRMLRLFRQLTGAAVFSVDPYQVGYENEEGIASGAFWFYRKLGFRPTGADSARLLEREERRLAADPSYRTGAATLRRLAAGGMIYEMHPSGDWDGFQVRNLGFAVQRRQPGSLDGLGLLLSGIPGVDKALQRRILRAKSGPEETGYLGALNAQPRLREAIIRMGSR